MKFPVSILLVSVFLWVPSSIAAQTTDFASGRPKIENFRPKTQSQTIQQPSVRQQMPTSRSEVGSTSVDSFSMRRSADGSPIIPGSIALIHDVDIAAQENGILKEILVEENQAIQGGQLLARIDDQVAQRQLEQSTLKHKIASQRASDNTEIEAAMKKFQLTASEYKTNYNLYKKGSKTKMEAQRSLYSRDIAQHELQAARNNKSLAAVERDAEMVNVKAANDSISRHRITSPLGGHIFKIEKDPGEWINAGETVMRIAPLDRLRVVGTISGKHYDPFEVADKPVTVTATLARGRKVDFKGTVVQTELEQRGKNLYLVVAEIENRYEQGTTHWILQPKSRVEMTIHVGNVSSATAQPPASPRLGNR